ncbi:MAG TPA: twin-arginine translocase subunit TatB, partial [Rhodospirillum rubrum]|nr:twin-arginine translocase subunit TatB [Rhodospirillum rubrum]
MFDLSWSEIALVGVVALIVIGPKDLPNVLRTAGKWVRKIRSLGSEFQRQMDDVMRETCLLYTS